MDEIDDVVVFNDFSVDLHLKLVVGHQLEHSLGNILVYYEVSTSFKHNFHPTFLARLGLLLISFFDAELSFGRIDGKQRVVSAQISEIGSFIIASVEEELLKAIG